MIPYILCASIIIGLLTMGVASVVEGWQKAPKEDEEELLLSLLDVEKALTESLMRFQEQRVHIISQIERLKDKGGSAKLIDQYEKDSNHLGERTKQMCEALYALWRTRMFAYFRWEYARLVKSIPRLPSFTEIEGEEMYKKAFVELTEFTHEIRRVQDVVSQKSIQHPAYLNVPLYIQKEVEGEKNSTEEMLKVLLVKVDDVCDQLLYVQDWFKSQKIDREARNIASLKSTKENIHSSLSDLNELLVEDVTLSFLKAEEEAEAQLIELKSASSDMGDRMRAEREVNEALRHLSKRKIVAKRRNRVG